MPRCFTVICCIILILACDQSVDEGTLNDSGSVDLVAVDGASATDVATGEQPVTDAAQGLSVMVIYQGQTHQVSLDKATPVEFEGTQHARVSEVVQLALPDAVLDSLEADFKSSDGWHPRLQDFCTDLIPLDGALLSKAYIDLESRKLRWDTDLQHPGCMYVKDLERILLEDK
jgi:hypothetical protein